MLELLEDNSRWQDFTDALTVGNEDSSSFDIGDFHITTIFASNKRRILEN